MGYRFLGMGADVVALMEYGRKILADCRAALPDAP
jgi:hypothetical protein